MARTLHYRGRGCSNHFIKFSGGIVAQQKQQPPEATDEFDEWTGTDDRSAGGDGLDDQFPVPEPDANAMRVTVHLGTHEGQPCAELFAFDHGPEPGKQAAAAPRKVLLARVTEAAMVTFPVIANPHRYDFLSSKYDDITTITVIAPEDEPWELPETVEDFDAMLEGLPVGFGRHARYGLGFRREYAVIPQEIEAIEGITEIVIEPGDAALAEGPRFRLGVERFTKIRKTIDMIAGRGQRRSLTERRLFTYNQLLPVADPVKFKERFPEVKPGEIHKIVELSSRAPKRSVKDGLAAAALVQEDAKQIASETPEKLLELKATIERVTLAELTARIEQMISQNLPEPVWQKFFTANPFVLSLAFPYPVLLIQDQAYVGGMTLSGRGERISDYLFAHGLTGGLALIEIKRPATLLLEDRPVRGDMRGPHKQLTGAIAQVLDQRYQLQRNFGNRKAEDEALRNSDITSVQCVVLAGKTPQDKSERRSLDLFRHSSKDVMIVTFDELLEKLKQLQRLMMPRPDDGSDLV